MGRLRYLWLLALTLVAVMLAVSLTAAQDDSTTLTLTSDDALFQPLAPGEGPLSTDFTHELTVPTDTGQPIIYVALTNTGWSSGTLVLVSDTLDPDAAYIALEVDADGVPVDGGLAFDLIPDSDLGGFVLPVLIAQMRTFAVFRVVEADGIAFVGQTNARDGDLVIQQAVEVMIDPNAVFAPLVLDCHIVARPIPIATPEFAETHVPGTWGECGSCDTCGFEREECTLSPTGECVWDPQCGACGGCDTCGHASEECLLFSLTGECVWFPSTCGPGVPDPSGDAPVDDPPPPGGDDPKPTGAPSG